MTRLIDADILIEDFNPRHSVDWYTPWIIAKINEQPTVDAAPVVHGEWIYKVTNNGKMIFECSNCKSLIAGRGRFCKECGAKMDGGDKE